MSSVIFEGVTKRFGDTVAVDDLSLEIAHQEFFCLLGPSGCGKTTTMRMIAGLESPDEGRIWIGDDLVFDSRDLTSRAPGKRGVGLVFQSYALWPHMTIKQNVQFGLRMRKVAKAEQERRLGETMELLKLTGLEGRYPNELSGGQQQRVALARELVAGADVLLMDEPLSNLDAQLRIDMRAELKRLHEDTGKTIIYVTHDQVEALTLSTKVGVMHEGAIQQVADPDTIYYEPQHVFVASFIGNVRINLMNATLEENRLVSAGLVVEFPPDRIAASVNTPTEVVLGFRPEDVTIRENPNAWCLDCRVESVMPMGPISLVQARIDGDPGESHVTLQHDRTRDLKRGQRIWVEIGPKMLHIFDKGSGGRIDHHLADLPPQPALHEPDNERASRARRSG
jgi:ABC-type sugar transport system ATPase subunit